ncbi:MAG: hypothetical protein ACE5HE_05105 [Phycisphaerae bacterium]
MVWMVRYTCNLGLILVAAAAGQVRGEILVEDFESPPGGGFNDPTFVHNVDFDEIAGAELNWSITDATYVSPGHSLLLAPATDYITFNLADGEYVDYAEVWMAGSPLLPVHMHVLGEDANGDPLDVWYASEPDESWVHVTTEGSGFAAISEIRLTSFKVGHFDDVVIRVVPEPATLALLLPTMAVLVVRSSRRRSYG